MSKELHVVFGTGPVGRTVTDELVVKGKSVRIVNRSGKADVPEGVDIVKGDATNPESTRTICEGAAVVYNCTNAPYDKWAQLLAPLYQGILEGAAAVGARLIVMDNLYMYGSTGGKPIVETLAYAATTRKGRIRAELAEYLMDSHNSGKVRVAIGRASDFFGPRVLMAAMGERVFYPALAGKPVQLLGNPDMPHTQSYIGDVAKGLVALGEQEEALGQTWHLPAPETVTIREFITMVGEELGYPLKFQVAPKFIIKILGWFNPVIREIPEMLYQFEEPFILDHNKFIRAFGGQSTPLKQAIKETIEWFRKNPK